MTLRPRPTSADVARLAGVSRGTVSNVLNGDVAGRVRPETARRVQEAAERLGYVPSAAARLLRGASARFVLVVAPPSFAHGVLGSLIVEGLARELEARELGLVQLTGHPEGLSPASHLSPAVVLTSATPDDPDFTGWRASFRVPVLPAFPGRDAHIAAAARAQAHHARSRGYSRVVYVAPPEPALATMSALRHDALGSWARRHGIAVADSVVLGRGRADWAEQARRLHDSHGPDVLVCAYNDDVALAVLAGASDAGLSVPTDLAVIGADDTPAAERSVPALTSVGADFSAFVNAMADTVEAAASGRPVELPSLPVDLQVAVRASSP